MRIQIEKRLSHKFGQPLIYSGRYLILAANFQFSGFSFEFLDNLLANSLERCSIEYDSFCREKIELWKDGNGEVVQVKIAR